MKACNILVVMILLMGSCFAATDTTIYDGGEVNIPVITRKDSISIHSMTVTEKNGDEKKLQMITVVTDCPNDTESLGRAKELLQSRIKDLKKTRKTSKKAAVPTVQENGGFVDTDTPMEKDAIAEMQRKDWAVSRPYFRDCDKDKINRCSNFTCGGASCGSCNTVAEKKLKDFFK